MTEVKRKESESFESLMRRFTKAVQRSGRVTEVKRRRYHERPLSELKTKRSAIRHKLVEGRISYLRKIGKYDNAMDLAARKKLLKIPKVKNS